MEKFNHLDMSDESLMNLLNFIMSMIKEDRENALSHHDTLAGMLGGPAGAEGMTSLEMQLFLNDLSTALTGFIKNSAQSTDQAIKIAKIMADHLTKMEKSATITDEDREQIESALKGISETTTGLSNVRNIIELDLSGDSDAN